MFTENKYSRWYFSIIESARNFPREGYVEEHHIHPTSMGGLDVPENIVKLTAREHFIVHLLLPKMLSNKKQLMQARKAIRFMMSVPKKMKDLRWIPKGRTFEIAKREAALANKGNKEIAAKISAAHKGKKLSDEHRRKIGAGNIGRPRPQASIDAQRGKPKSEAAKLKMKEAWIERRVRIAQGLETRKPMSEEARRNISASKKGKSLSAQHRANISAGLLASAISHTRDNT